MHTSTSLAKTYAKACNMGATALFLRTARKAKRLACAVSAKRWTLDANGLGGGSVRFNGIKVNGLIAASIDILSRNSFLQAAGAAGVTNPGTFYNAQTGGDVVQIAIPADVQVAASNSN